MINFLFNKIFNDQDFAKLTGGGLDKGEGLDKGGGARQRGGLDSVEYGTQFIILVLYYFNKSQ